MNRVLIHYCNTKNPHYLSLHLWFYTPTYNIVSPENQAMFWASPGPVPLALFPGTAISFLFLPFIFLLSSLRLAATSPARNCLSRESQGQVLSLSKIFTQAEIYIVAVSPYLLVSVRFLVASSAHRDRKHP